MSENWLAEELHNDKKNRIGVVIAVLATVGLLALGGIGLAASYAKQHKAAALTASHTPTASAGVSVPSSAIPAASTLLKALTTADYSAIQSATTAANSLATALNTDDEGLAQIDSSQFESAVYGVEDIQTTKYTPTLSSGLTQLASDLESASSDYTQSFEALQSYETALNEEATAINPDPSLPSSYSYTAQSDKSEVTSYLSSASDEISNANFEITELNFTH